MSALRMIERRFAGRTWYRLLRPNGRVFAGALRSPAEASARARQGRHHIVGVTDPARPLTKDTAACCLAKRLPDGRPVIGFCGPDCRRRPAGPAA